ncbi:MAG TPA: DUF2510 domain-containing protein [Galbitalea sp.]
MTLAIVETFAPAGWYPDPAGSNQLRWWSGSYWTVHLEPNPSVVYDAYPRHTLRKPGA